MGSKSQKSKKNGKKSVIVSQGSPRSGFSVSSVHFPRPYRAGDKLTSPDGSIYEVVGLFTVRGHSPEDMPVFSDWIRLREFSSGQALDKLVEDVETWHKDEAQSPNICSAYRCDNLATALESALKGLGGGLVSDVIKAAYEKGYHLYVVGGAIRDHLVGRADQIKDIDMTGDMPPGLFADLVACTALSKWEGERSSARRVWVPNISLSTTGTVHLYLWHTGTTERWREDHFLEYAPLKAKPIAWETDIINERHGATDNFPYTFLFGHNIMADHKWHDLSINSLLFDPNAAPDKPQLLDPAGAITGEHVSGITPETISQWQPGGPRRAVTIKPLDLPARTDKTYVKTYWVAQAVARIIKSLVKFEDKDNPPNSVPVLTWIKKHTNELQHVLAKNPNTDINPSPLRSHLRGQLNIGDDKPIPKARVIGALRRLLYDGVKAEVSQDTITALTNYLDQVDASEQWEAETPRVAPTEQWLLHFFTLVVAASQPSTHRFKGAWPEEGVEARELRFQNGGWILGDFLGTIADGPSEKVARAWRQATREYGIVDIEIRDVGRVVVFLNPSRKQYIVPIGADSKIVNAAVERSFVGEFREEERKKFVTLFSPATSGEKSPGARVRVTPDHEAPDDAHWPKEWGPPPTVRSKPNPRSNISEADYETHKTDEMKELELLQRLRDAGLVRVAGEDRDLFWACMNSGEVALTPLGVYFWHEEARQQPHDEMSR